MTMLDTENVRPDHVSREQNSSQFIARQIATAGLTLFYSYQHGDPESFEPFTPAQVATGTDQTPHFGPVTDSVSDLLAVSTSDNDSDIALTTDPFTTNFTIENANDNIVSDNGGGSLDQNGGVMWSWTQNHSWVPDGATQDVEDVDVDVAVAGVNDEVSVFADFPVAVDHVDDVSVDEAPSGMLDGDSEEQIDTHMLKQLDFLN